MSWLFQDLVSGLIFSISAMYDSYVTIVCLFVCYTSTTPYMPQTFRMQQKTKHNGTRGMLSRRDVAHQHALASLSKLPSFFLFPSSIEWYKCTYLPICTHINPCWKTNMVICNHQIDCPDWLSDLVISVSNITKCPFSYQMPCKSIPSSSPPPPPLPAHYSHPIIQAPHYWYQLPVVLHSLKDQRTT